MSCARIKVMWKLHQPISVSLLKSLIFYRSWRVFAVFQFRNVWLPACCLGRQSFNYTQLQYYVFFFWGGGVRENMICHHDERI